MPKSYTYFAMDATGDEVTGLIVATDQNDAIQTLKSKGLFPTKINEKIHMTLATALKTKNRLAGELVHQQNILSRENARRNDSSSKVNRAEVWKNIITLSDELGSLKGRITVANIGIYPMLERMAELKSRIAYIQNLNKREDVEIMFVGRDQEKMEYRWNSFINQEDADKRITALQEEINRLQDEIDKYNAVTTIE
jgi:uncharacterized small protein (DUF1192 family)